MSPPAQACLDSFEALPDAAQTEVALAILRSPSCRQVIPLDDDLFVGLIEHSVEELQRHANH